MSNPWDQVKFKPAQKESSTDKSIPGGKYIGVGKHVVRIEDIVPASTSTGKPYLKMTYANSAGQTIKDLLFLTTNDGRASYKYNSISHALLKEDAKLRFEVFTASAGMIPSNPQMWEGMLGLYVVANVAQGNRGYTIKDDGGVYRLMNVETNEFYELAGGVPNEFENYAEAREVAGAQGLQRAWNEVKEFEASEKHIKSNREAIQELVDSQVKGSL